MIKTNYITVSQASIILGYTTGHIRRLIINKTLKAEKVGKTWLIKQNEIKSFNKRRKKHGIDKRSLEVNSSG